MKMRIIGCKLLLKETKLEQLLPQGSSLQVKDILTFCARVFLFAFKHFEDGGLNVTKFVAKWVKAKAILEA